MAKMLKKSFDSPEETRPMKKGKAEVVDLGGVTAMRVTFEPGWRWSECVKPIVGTQVAKLPTSSGALQVAFNNAGTEGQFGLLITE